MVFPDTQLQHRIRLMAELLNDQQMRYWGMTALQHIPLTTISGDATDLGDFAGKVLLIVNVASKCGLTPQYAGLEKLYEQHRADGLEVLGFPANNFGAQEPGTDAEIVEFCSTTFSVAFPMFSKISVVGDDQHPLYAALTTAAPHAAGDPDSFRERLAGFGMTPNQDPDVLWNFEKFLVARDGTVVARFAPTITPDDPALVAAIEAELAT
jgi:glutathione peroxidase